MESKLQSARLSSQWSAEQVASRIGAKPWVVHRWETGQGRPNLQQSKKLEKLFGLSITDLGFEPILEDIGISSWREE